MDVTLDLDYSNQMLLRRNDGSEERVEFVKVQVGVISADVEFQVGSSLLYIFDVAVGLLSGHFQQVLKRLDEVITGRAILEMTQDQRIGIRDA